MVSRSSPPTKVQANPHLSVTIFIRVQTVEVNGCVFVLIVRFCFCVVMAGYSAADAWVVVPEGEEEPVFWVMDPSPQADENEDHDDVLPYPLPTYDSSSDEDEDQADVAHPPVVLPFALPTYDPSEDGSQSEGESVGGESVGEGVDFDPDMEQEEQENGEEEVFGQWVWWEREE